jgi:DNA-binding IclR family transcriptional regulator
MRQRVLTALAGIRSRPTTRTLADAIGLPTSVVGRVCDDLAALGVVARDTDLAGSERRWSLSDDAQLLIRGAGLTPSEVRS